MNPAHWLALCLCLCLGMQQTVALDLNAMSAAAGSLRTGARALRTVTKIGTFDTSLVTKGLAIHRQDFEPKGKGRNQCPNKEVLEGVALNCMDGFNQDDGVVGCIVCSGDFEPYKRCGQTMTEAFPYCTMCEDESTRGLFPVFCEWCQANVKFKHFYRTIKKQKCDGRLL